MQPDRITDRIKINAISAIFAFTLTVMPEKVLTIFFFYQDKSVIFSLCYYLLSDAPPQCLLQICAQHGLEHLPMIWIPQM